MISCLLVPEEVEQNSEKLGGETFLLACIDTHFQIQDNMLNRLKKDGRSGIIWA